MDGLFIHILMYQAAGDEDGPLVVVFSGRSLFIDIRKLPGVLHEQHLPQGVSADGDDFSSQLTVKNRFFGDGGHVSSFRCRSACDTCHINADLLLVLIYLKASTNQGSTPDHFRVAFTGEPLA